LREKDKSIHKSRNSGFCFENYRLRIKNDLE